MVVPGDTLEGNTSLEALSEPVEPESQSPRLVSKKVTRNL